MKKAEMILTKNHPTKTELSEITLKDLKDYTKEMEEFNRKMKLLDKDGQNQAKKERGRNWRGGYLMAMVILNANNSSILALQKERDNWFLAAQKMEEITKNAESMVNIQTNLSQNGMTRENELKHEHQQEVRKYLEVLTLLKQFPDRLQVMLQNKKTDEEIVKELQIIAKTIKNSK